MSEPVYRDLDFRKSMHVKLLTDTHAGLKMRAAQLKLSMQSIIEELAIKVVQDDPYIIDLLKDMSRRKRDRQTRALADSDADTLLDYLEES